MEDMASLEQETNIRGNFCTIMCLVSTLFVLPVKFVMVTDHQAGSPLRVRVGFWEGFAPASRVMLVVFL
jgi:hypothetical protein